MSSTSKISILGITSELPWPLDTGGKIRTYHMLRALAEAYDIRLIVPVASSNDSAINHLQDVGINIIPVQVGPRKKIKEFGKVIKAFLSCKPYVLYQRHYHSAVRTAILKTAHDKKPDLLYLDHLDSFLYRSVLPSCQALIDLHNVYSLVVDRFATEQGNLIKRIYCQRETKLLHQVEQQLKEQIDLLFSVSQSEVDYYQQLGIRSAYLIPNGVDCSLFEKLPCGRDYSSIKLLFLGTMSWGPNAHAASFLIESVMPEIRKRHPSVELWIVGRQPPANVLAHNNRNGVHVTGGVPDVIPYFENAQFLLVPLESGGGTRLKILEAFAAGLPVVSTAVGVEGIDARDGVHLTIVERSNFANKVLDMIDNPDQGIMQAVNARKLVQAKYDWNSVGKQAVHIIQERIQAKQQCNL